MGLDAQHVSHELLRHRTPVKRLRRSKPLPWNWKRVGQTHRAVAHMPFA
jgi:hypothetical protein